jgi:hypothetical protein
MIRTVYYVAHPVSGDVDGNVERALRWLRWLRRQNKDIAYQAPWIACILCGEDDNDPEQRERGLLDCEATAARMNGIVLVGGRISSGMQRELDAVRSTLGDVIDLTHLGPEPPASSSMRGIVQMDLTDLDEPVRGGQ